MSVIKLSVLKIIFGIVVPFIGMYFWGKNFPVIDVIPVPVYAVMALLMGAYVWVFSKTLPAEFLSTLKTDLNDSVAIGQKHRWINFFVLGLPVFLAAIGMGASTHSVVLLVNAKAASHGFVQELPLVAFERKIRAQKHTRHYYACFFERQNPHNRGCFRVSKNLYQKINKDVVVSAKVERGFFDIRWVREIKHPDALIWENPQD